MSGAKSDPVRPIRSLLRGLDALAALGGADGLSVTETARRARLPRTTAYRILETLRLGGFIERDANDLYRLTIKAAIVGGPDSVGPLADGRIDAA